ncbi:hypothetical protein AB6A40_011583, partial [Gnathostoma spinigerum]
LVMAYLLRHFDIVQCEQTEKRLNLIGSVTFAPEKVTVKLTKRQR